MGQSVNLGGDRLGSGNKQKVYLHNYERSTHDLGYIWRSTMASGTLVPFLKQVALPGDTFDVDINADVKTLPTVGPLFGSFKMQIDLFLCPIRLYNKSLHMNKIGVGMDMSKVKFPYFELITNNLVDGIEEPIEVQQINQSSLLAYLGIRGNGFNGDTDATYVKNNYNAMPLLAYWDIYKNYYSNKQEEIGAVISHEYPNVESVTITSGLTNTDVTINNDFTEISLSSGNINDGITIRGYNIDIYMFRFWIGAWRLSNYFNIINKYVQNDGFTILTFKHPTTNGLIKSVHMMSNYNIITSPKVETFPLASIDKQREFILSASDAVPYDLTHTEQDYTQGQDILGMWPYALCNTWLGSVKRNAAYFSQQGLGLKTYQSDIFNNWLNKEWIEGTTGINEISAVDTSSGSFSIDTLNLAKKVYDMLNRIAVSGGSYEDWLSAVYSHEPYRRAESPMYMGGLSKEVVFQEVVGNAGFENQEGQTEALGTLAGRGVMSSKHKGGKVVIKVDEPSYIMGIVSLTPRIDYSQGNEWDVHLNTMNDLHKPALDQIGFQDLVTEKMASWERHTDTAGNVTLYSAGKQPAWIDYMTNYNRCYGNFANPNDQMFMTLNRRYEYDRNGRIKDLTTYIDPQKFNYIFADTERDAQNFWVQLAVDITARRKMSAKVMPNL